MYLKKEKETCTFVVKYKKLFPAEGAWDDANIELVEEFACF